VNSYDARVPFECLNSNLPSLQLVLRIIRCRWLHFRSPPCRLRCRSRRRRQAALLAVHFRSGPEAVAAVGARDRKWL